MADARIPQLDGFRAIAFLTVFAHHAIKMPFGWLGVDMFFVLSGFLITRNLLELRETATTGSALKVFYFRRLLRIVPPYYLAMTLIWIATRHAYEMRWYYLFVSNFRDVTTHTDGLPLSTMWSIAVEEQFYLLWPWLVLLVPRRAMPYLFGALIVAAPGVRMAMALIDREAVYRLMPSRMDLLAAGALLTYFDLRSPVRIELRRRTFAVAGVIAAAVFLVLAARDPEFRARTNDPWFNTVGYSLSVVMFTSALAYVRGSHTGLAHAVLSHPRVRYIGRISYMGYLTHGLFLVLFSKTLHLGLLPSALLGLISTLAFSSASWHLLEKPILGLWRLVPPTRKSVGRLRARGSLSPIRDQPEPEPEPEDDGRSWDPSVARPDRRWSTTPASAAVTRSDPQRPATDERELVEGLTAAGDSEPVAVRAGRD